MSKGKLIRWGICGVGKISQDFCANLMSLSREEHEVVAVAGRSLERAKEFAGRFSIAKAYESYEQLAQDNDVDIVYVGTIHPTHFDCCVKMFEYNKHVLCEKPMTMNANQTRKLIETAQSKKLFLMEAMWTRFFPAVLKLQELIATGTIGDVKLVKADFCMQPPERVDRLYDPALGGGATLDVGIYTIAMASLIFGGGRPENIKATGYLTDTGVDELASITIKYPGNRVASLCCSLNLNLPKQAHIYGSKGILTLAEPFWCTTQLQTPSGNLDFPLPKPDLETIFTNGRGMTYEAEAVRRCLVEGKTECEAMPLDETLIIAETMDSILEQLGVKY